MLYLENCVTRLSLFFMDYAFFMDYGDCKHAYETA